MKGTEGMDGRVAGHEDDGGMPSDGAAGPPSFEQIWQQAARHDGMLPPEKELSALLGIGRNTVRETLIRLEADGLVARRHGAGTFTNLAALDVQIRIDQDSEYAEILRGAGINAEVEVIDSGWDTLPVPGSERLEAQPGTPAFRTRKRWFADGVPVMLADDVIPARRRADVAPTDSVFQIAQAINGRRTDWVCSWITPVVAGDLSSFLGCPPEQPVLRLEQVGVARGGSRCWAATEYHNPAGHPGGLQYGLVRTVIEEPGKVDNT